jgi:hypothetical protein
VSVHVSRFTADESFIHFDVTGQFPAVAFILQRQANPMQHEPRSLLSNSQRAVKLPRANPVSVVRNHPNSGKPLIKTDRRILEHSTGLY